MRVTRLHSSAPTNVAETVSPDLEKSLEIPALLHLAIHLGGVYNPVSHSPGDYNPMPYNPVAIHLGLVIQVHEENGTEMSLRIRFPDAKKDIISPSKN